MGLFPMKTGDYGTNTFCTESTSIISASSGSFQNRVQLDQDSWSLPFFVKFYFSGNISGGGGRVVDRRSDL